MSQGEEEYLAKLRKDTAEARTLFSNAQKPERERMVVRAFLHCIGEEFADDEIQLGADEPVDVAFRDARFQISEILGDRQRGREFQEREQRYNQAKRLSDLSENFKMSEAFSLSAAAQFVAKALANKASRYGIANCAKLDALVYLNLKDRHLDPKADRLSVDAVSAEELGQQGWRSVSIISSPYGVVLAASRDAPEFLVQKQGRIFSCWSQLDGLFDP